MESLKCWCGNVELLPFSPDYRKCLQCETLVLSRPVGPEKFRVFDDATDFYGEQYYKLFVQDKYGYPGLADRSRLDIPERCLHWLKTILKYKLPPGRTVELGCAHGGLVALMNWAGYEASGLELSPSIVKFAHETFDIPVRQGPIEEQQYQPGSLDAIVLMDVLEHFRDPFNTMRHCLSLLKDDGIIIIQTPRYPEHKSFSQLEKSNDTFLLQLKPDEHIYLFSQHSVATLFSMLGAKYIAFEPAIFAHYDMFLAISKRPFSVNSTENIEKSLLGGATSRLILALLDLDRLRPASS
jgi:2-polyprenyl-3-methyl-5-hydroxy-6-metoxy-1,4-benzoquinol methylase